MEKTKLAEVLGHQLKGIMLHTDLCKQALYIGNNRLADKHYRQVQNETKVFMLTNKHIIDKTGCIVEPTQQGRIVVPVTATKDQMCDMWKTWEHETMMMYCDVIKLEPECGFWQKLYRCVKKELTTI